MFEKPYKDTKFKEYFETIFKFLGFVLGFVLGAITYYIFKFFYVGANFILSKISGKSKKKEDKKGKQFYFDTEKQNKKYQKEEVKVIEKINDCDIQINNNPDVKV